jgi:hypothetical protein
MCLQGIGIMYKSYKVLMQLDGDNPQGMFVPVIQSPGPCADQQSKFSCSHLTCRQKEHHALKNVGCVHCSFSERPAAARKEEDAEARMALRGWQRGGDDLGPLHAWRGQCCQCVNRCLRQAPCITAVSGIEKAHLIAEKWLHSTPSLTVVMLTQGMLGAEMMKVLIWHTPKGIIDEGGKELEGYVNFNITLFAPPENDLMHVSCCVHHMLNLPSRLMGSDEVQSLTGTPVQIVSMRRGLLLWCRV